ncbi:hypothetical protein BDB00DRAFT_843106 [Zychaea mexicana]|uniref:uncharacterized protein n=1 Tax=Zychaea mexicana TaxID=64656 RepID=UPI0022FF213C|nr:uncharacterized protein BDB00DRAFT_843106 [Zychaea mexicana]KAI9489473.1 hypothetical protein BDB00DRAFT_843106 [Zychaea mexicana]
MDSPKPMNWWFHYEAQGTHLLFESFVIESGVSLFFGYVFIVAMCWSERAVTYYLDRPKPGEGSGTEGGRSRQWKDIILRTVLYGVATTLRLWYMLVTMYFNIGFFIVVVVALTSGQLVVEALKATR